MASAVFSVGGGESGAAIGAIHQPELGVSANDIQLSRNSNLYSLRKACENNGVAAAASAKYATKSGVKL